MSLGSTPAPPTPSTTIRFLPDAIASRMGGRCGGSSDVQLELGQHRQSAVVKGRGGLGVRQAAGRDDRPRDAGRNGHEVSRWSLQAPICPYGAEGIPANLLGDRRQEAEAAVRSAPLAHQFVHGPRTALGVNDEPDLDRQVRRSGDNLGLPESFAKGPLRRGG